MSVELLGLSSLGRGVSRTAFINALEKHLDDYQRGRGYLSNDTAKEIAKKHRANGSLSAPDLSLYSQYTSALDYKSKAYFVSAVNDVRKTIDFIQSAGARAEEFTADLKRSLGYA